MTAIDGLPGKAGGAARDGTATAAASPATRAATLATTLRQPCASRSPAHPDRSAHWMRSNGMGSTQASMRSWTSLRSVRARSASDCTHSDFAASSDQITTTALAALSRSSITSA